MTCFSVDPEQLMVLARRIDALAGDLAQATALRDVDATALGSAHVHGAMSGFTSHQADGIAALHASLANGAQRLAQAAVEYRAVDDDVAAAAGG
jgi:Excreted virulence factor EspC, type VII ESX diderm